MVPKSTSGSAKRPHGVCAINALLPTFYAFQKLYFYNPEIMLSLAFLCFLLHIIGRSARHFHNLAESVLVGSAAFQTDGYLIGTYRLVHFQMYVSQTLFRVPAPNQLVSGIHFQRITAGTPAVQLDADVVDARLFSQCIGNPGRT